MRFVHSILSFALVSTLFAAPAFAADDGKKIGVGGDALLTIPLGDLADATGPLIGASLRLGYYIMPQLEAYLRIGYQFGITKEREIDLGLAKFTSKVGFDLIPVLIGGRYFLEDYSGLYFGAEIGAHMLKGKGEVNGTTIESDTQTRFGANLGLGYVVSPEFPLHFGAQFSLLNLAGKENSEEKTQTAINFLVGYEARF